MHPFLDFQLMVGVILLSVALLYGVIALKGYHRSLTLPFALASLFGAAEAFSAPLTYLGENVSDVIAGIKISTGSVCVYAVSLVWFAAGYGGGRKRRIPLTLSIYGLILLLLVIFLPGGLIYQSISGLRPVRLPWGEAIVTPVGKVHPLMMFAHPFGALCIAYLLSVYVRLWRRKERRRAVSFALGFAPLFFVAYPLGLLVDRGILPPPYLYSFSLLSLVLVMNLSLVNEALKSDRLSKEIEASERRWRSVLDGISLLVAGCDVAGRFNYVNPFIAETTGYREEELLGTDFCKLIPPKDRDRVTRDLERAFQGELSPRSELMLRTKSGVDKVIAWSNVSLREIDGDVIGILSVGTDITDRLNAERARDEAQGTAGPQASPRNGKYIPEARNRGNCKRYQHNRTE